jgi:hypothetical protein
VSNSLCDNGCHKQQKHRDQHYKIELIGKNNCSAVQLIAGFIDSEIGDIFPDVLHAACLLSL